MAVFTYRTVFVNLEDKHVGAGPTKRRRGSNVDRRLSITDTGQSGTVEIADRDGDDYPQFMEHARQGFIEYLNQLGQDGWKVIQGDMESGRSHRWPKGWYFLMRETAA